MIQTERGLKEHWHSTPTWKPFLAEFSTEHSFYKNQDLVSLDLMKSMLLLSFCISVVCLLGGIEAVSIRENIKLESLMNCSSVALWNLLSSFSVFCFSALCWKCEAFHIELAWHRFYYINYTKQFCIEYVYPYTVTGMESELFLSYYHFHYCHC